MPNQPDDTEAYNRFQRAYCEGPVSRTITPRESRHVVRQLNEVLRVAALTTDDRVLEVGCGMGRFTLKLAERGINVEGLDLSPVLLDRLRASAGERLNIRLHCSDVLAPPPALHDSFDVVLAFLVLHHLRDVGDAIAAMALMLKPGGRLIILDANGYNPLFYLQIVLMRGITWQGDKGMMQMRPRIVRDAMLKAGLHESAVTRFGFLPAFVTDRAWGSRLDAALERLPLPDVLHAFQIFSARRT
jgi:SAM-dependent methyltransferase